MKRTLMATGAALLLAAGTLAIPSAASAQNRHGHSGGPSISAGPRMSGGPSHFSGGPSHFSGSRNFSFNRGFARHRFRGPGVGFAFASPYVYDYGYDDCWEWRRIHTRYGWRTVRVNVCY